MNDSRLWGLLAEFPDHESRRLAAHRVRAAGVSRLDAYSPFPLDAVADAIGVRRTRLGWAVLAAGITGAGTGYLLQWWTSAIAYPLNVGGRPLNSWPVFVPVMFELTVLFAALTAIIGTIVRSGLPRLHHPLFAVPAFERATTDGFFLSVEADDPQFDADRTRALLVETGASRVFDVPA
jgi:hypothetical protein